MRPRLADLLTALFAAIAIGAPFAREHLVMDMASEPMPTSALTPQIMLAGQLLVTLLALFGVFLSAVRGRQGRIPQRLAALPPLHTAFLAGSAVAIGLGAFNLCCAHHAVAGGTCHCWLTGALAAMGALLAGLLCLTGRTLTELTREVVRILVALFILLERLARIASTRLHRTHAVRILGGPHLARHIAGRAPPLSA